MIRKSCAAGRYGINIASNSLSIVTVARYPFAKDLYQPREAAHVKSLGELMVRATLGAIVISFLSLAQPTTTRAIMMTFDQVPDQDLVEDASTYLENGLMMSLMREHYDITGEQVQIDTYGGDGQIRFEMADGSIFNLNSLYVYADDYLTRMDPSEPVVVEYRLSFSDGSTLLIDSGTASTMMLHKEDISYFTYAVITRFGCTTTQFNTRLDNIDVSPVPEPSTMLLLGSGLLSLVGLMRRRCERNSSN